MSLTPNRKTTATFDIAETVTGSQFWGFRRRGGEIAQDFANGQFDDDKHQNIEIWPTGAITLKPLQAEITNIQEYAVGLGHVVAPDNPTLLETLSVIPSMVIENTFRQNTDLPGMTYASGVAALGAPYIVRKIPAGGSFDEALASAVPNVPASPSVLGGSAPGPAPVPLDRVGESLAPYPEDQGFFLTWDNPGTSTTYAGAYFAFYFGQYAVAFTGSGFALLYENAQDAVSGVKAWKFRWTWRYDRASGSSSGGHSMAIWPHLGPQGQKFICFTSSGQDYAQVASSYARTNVNATSPGYATYQARYDPRFVDQSPGHVTTADLIRFDIRRDWKMPLQISTLGWPTSGFLIDEPASLPQESTAIGVTVAPIRAYAETTELPGATITPSVINPATGAAFDQSADTHLAARFDFAGDGTNTPILWAYNMNRDAVQEVSAPGQFTAKVNGVSVVGYSGDPTQESAHLVIEDLSGKYSRLRGRGLFRARIDVQHVEQGVTYITPIFSGYALRPSARRRGKNGRTYPSVDWFHFDIPFTGMSMRLVEQTSSAALMNVFGHDYNASPVTGFAFIPWKVTDALRYLLACAGFSPAQINIPDLPMRLWPGIEGKTDNQAINPNTDYGEMALRLCRNYLGAYLCYESTLGQWILLEGGDITAPPLYSFYSTSPPGKVPTEQGAYGPNATLIVDDLTFTTVPPAFNFIHVFCPLPLTGQEQTPTIIENFAYNFNSYQVPGSPITPDPSVNNPEYIGRQRPREIGDISLRCVVGGGLTGDTDEAATQRAVDWTVRRLYEFCCHAQRITHFRAPLVFVVDPVTGVYRIPRFMDTISVNGTPYLVKSCLPDYKSDLTQIASYEVINPIPGQYVPPGIESLEFFRQATDKRSRKVTGSYTSSNELAMIGIPPHAEHRHRDLPRAVNFQRPLQDPATGLFYEMAGYDPAGIGEAP